MRCTCVALSATRAKADKNKLLVCMQTRLEERRQAGREGFLGMDLVWPLGLAFLVEIGLPCRPVWVDPDLLRWGLFGMPQ